MIARRPRWMLPVLAGAPLVTAAIVAGIFFYRSTATPALTQKDTVVLSSVINRTGDTMFDDTLGEALALQLRQSPFLNLVAEQQVQATLRLMGREPMTPLTAEAGREVCRRAGARALLGGTIATLGSSYVLTLAAQDCVVGTVLAEAQAQSADKEGVLTALGTAVSAFREKLGESLASIQRYDAKIEEATTSSLEALKAYSQGLRTRRTTGDFDAVPFFRRALELDPGFALAYARLGTVYNNLGQADEGRRMTTRAYELRQKVSEAERLSIEARYYHTVQNDVPKALDAYNVWLATYPNDYTALTSSAVLHQQQGDRAEAIRKLELATRAAPDQPLAWTSLGQTYFEGGQYVEAKRAMETAITLQDSTSARVGVYQAAIYLGDLALADRQVAAVRGRRDEIDMVAIRMFAATYRGRMKEAAELATDYQARAIALSRPQSAGHGVMQLAISETLVGLIDRATARIEKAQDEGILGNEAPVERLALAAIAAVAERRPLEAAALLDPVLEFRSSLTDVVSIWTFARMQAGDRPSAVKGLTFLVSSEARGRLSASPAYAHAALGRLHAQLGQKDDARRHYQQFFELFKDADPDLPLLVQSREESAKLGLSS